MNIYMMKEDAKQQISGNIGTFLLMNIAIYAISAILCLIPGAGGILGYAAEAIFSVSMILIFLALSAGIEPQFTDIFEIFKNTRLCGNAILLTVLTSLYVILWSLLLIIPGIIKSLSYAMAPFILAENNVLITPSEALAESEKIMRGHKADLFKLILSFIGWWFLTIITCGIASIYVVPYYIATLTNFYNSIKDTPIVTAN